MKYGKKITHPTLRSPSEEIRITLMSKGRRLQDSGFTLVELIVVITILAILGTISFISMQSYSKNSRDSVRISDMNQIKSSLELYQIDSNKYPDPTSAEPVTYSGGLAWYQGIFGNSTFINVSRLDKIPTDPLTGKEYAYSVLNTKQEYEIAGILEGDDIVLNNEIFNTVNAAEKTARAMITGTYNGLSLRVNNPGISYVLAVPSIITSIDLAVELNRKLETIIPEKEMVLSSYKNLPSNYVGTSYNSNKETTNGDYEVVKGNDILNMLIFEGDIADLTSEILVTKLQNAYSGTTVEIVGTTNELLSLSTTDIYKEDIVDNYAVAFINNNLGGEAVNRIYATCDGIAHNTTKAFYTGNTVTFTEGTCDILRQDYICRDGIWKDGVIVLNTSTYPYDTCLVDGARTCDISTIDPVNTVTINHADTYTLYSQNNIAWDAVENCTDLLIEGSVKCNDSILEGDTGYSYNTCVKGTPLNCEAQTQGTLQTYSIPALNHTQTHNAQTDISENYGTFRYTISTTCNDGILSPAETGPTLQTCNLNYTIVGDTCVADTQLYTCAGKPLTGTLWNTVSDYTQTWNGSAWLPSETFTVYNTSGSIEECNYICDTGYHTEDGGTTCVLDTGTCSITNGTGLNTWNGTTWDCTVATCDTDYYNPGDNTCTAVGIGYYSNSTETIRNSCTTYPDTSSRNYTYTSDGNGTNSCAASYTQLCGTDLYETVNGTCSAVGTGYYSANLNNTRPACTNKPTYSIYTTDGGGVDNCSFSCTDGYTGINCEIAPFSCGTSTVSAGTETYTTIVGLDGNCWTSQNMRHGTKLADGSTMPTNDTTIQKWCYDIDANGTYDQAELDNCNIEGGLYTYDEAMGYGTTINTEDTAKSVCGQLGAGWKLPTDTQWSALTTAGATGWTGVLPNGKLGGIISSLPGGRFTGASFGDRGTYGYWWSSTESVATNSWLCFLGSGGAAVSLYAVSKASGVSVVCIKN